MNLKELDNVSILSIETYLQERKTYEATRTIDSIKTYLESNKYYFKSTHLVTEIAMIDVNSIKVSQKSFQFKIIEKYDFINGSLNKSVNINYMSPSLNNQYKPITEDVYIEIKNLFDNLISNKKDIQIKIENIKKTL